MNRKRRKKLLIHIMLLTFLMSNILNLTSFKKAFAEEIILINEGFDAGIAAPEGWSFENIGGTYTTTSNFGQAPPSLKLDSSTDKATTKQFSNPSRMSFWIKGQSTDGNSSLTIEGYDGTAWNIIDSIKPLPTSGTTKAYNLNTNYIQVRFSYFKSVGNLALDDVKVFGLSGDVIPVSGITLDKSEASLEEGQTLTLVPTITPENAGNKSVAWSSSDSSAAMVDKGVVTGVKAGKAVITATTLDGGKTASCTVTVTPKSNVDNRGPEVTNMAPGSGDYTGDVLRPVISGSFSDESGIDLSSIKLFLDNNEVTNSASISETGFTYTPEKDLSLGQHMVRLEIRDKAEVPNTSIVEWNFYVGKEVYNTYFGQLHSHTNYSDGQGTPEEAYAWARDMGKADFFAVTDHSNSLDSDTSATLADGSMSSEWKNLHTIADKYNENGKFTAIAGFEMTWSGSTGGWGHINTFNTNGFLSRNSKIGGKAVDLQMYYNEIKKYPESISQLNHPGSTFGDFNDFGYYDPQVDKVVSMIEVGNGEGPVRGTGYFPSYELYTRALDKGWHVAPTNNQDNHKAGWVTANNARTVVLAPSLSRESVYDALRNMRTYATEDSNLRIMYKVNNKVMGSFLSKPSSLDINIDINDPDSLDKIGKVSIISNGGVVVASKTFDSNNASWNLKVDPKYTYYYVRIDQADKDIAVTAPVWTADNSAVGLSKVSASQNLYITNTPVDLTATVYNNGSTELSPVNVEFYVNEILPENKIGETLSGKILPGGTSDAKINWTPANPGSYLIYARISLAINGEEKVFTESTKVEVMNSEDVVKVVVDAGHYNQYVSGDYAGKITTLKAMLGERKFLLYENRDALTSDDLKDAKILILTDPQSKDKSSYKLYKSLYTDAEVNTIKYYVNNGGSLIITSRADYDDKGVTDPVYETANQGNKVLEVIGSNLRFNDDEVIDKTTNGGQEFRLYFDHYTSNKYGLTNNIPKDLTYSAYSGCSVILKDGGSEENVDWLVKGHETTEILDSDLQNDAASVEKGNVNSLAAEVLPGGGKLIAAGTTFFSDFEIAGDNLYGNKQITDNILSWMTRPELSTIAAARVDSDKDGKMENLGKKFTVEGRVTAATKSAVKNTAFFDVMYVQDETGGITVFGVSNKSVPLGARVRVVGTVDQYDGDAELQISNENYDIEILDDTISPVQPREMSTGESMLEENEGWLVKTQGIVKSMTENSIYIDDGTGLARIYVNGYIGDDTDNPDMLGKWDKNIKPGDLVSAIGLASEDPEGHRLRVRNTSEIVKLKTPVTGVTLDKSELTLIQGEVADLIAEITPVDATFKEVQWSSSNPQVASVDENGRVTAKAIGFADITVTTLDGSFKDSCRVAVVDVPVDGVRINRDTLIMESGKHHRIVAVVYPGNSTFKDVLWTSSDENIAVVDKTGNITAKAAGVVKISAQTIDGRYIGECTVFVFENNKKSIVLPSMFMEKFMLNK